MNTQEAKYWMHKIFYESNKTHMDSYSYRITKSNTVYHALTEEYHLTAKIAKECIRLALESGCLHEYGYHHSLFHSYPFEGTGYLSPAILKVRHDN